MRLWQRWALSFPLCLGLSACGIFGGSEPAHQPAELKPIEQPQVKVKVLWRRGVGDGAGNLFSALRPVVHGKIVFAADAHGNVWAFNKENGNTIWKHSTHLRLLSGPSLAAGLILVGSLNGQVVALDPETGEKRWRVQLSSEVLSAPAGADGTVVVRCVDGIVYGVSSSNGTRRWSFERNQPRLTLRGTSKPLITGGEAIIGLDNGKLAALSTDTGEVDWQTVLAVPSGGSELEQLVDVDGRLGEDGSDLFAASYGEQLAALGLQTGRVLWRDKIASYSGVTLGRDTLFVSDIDSTLFSLDSFTGARQWKSAKLSYRGLTRPVLQGDNLVVGDREGYLHWFTRAGGRLVGRFQVEDGGFTSAPAVAGNRLYVEADNGRLTALQVMPVNPPSENAPAEPAKSKPNPSRGDNPHSKTSTGDSGIATPGLPAAGSGGGF